jgi:superfamily II DNA or RNA helicase
MKIEYFLTKKFNGKELAYSNQEFIKRVFYPRWKEYGLDLINPEVQFISSSGERYFIDFVIQTEYRSYLIEIDDYGSHAGSPDRFTKHNEKIGDIQSSLDLNEFNCDLLKNKKIYPSVINLTLNQIKENPESCVNYLNKIFRADEHLNIYFSRKYSNDIKPTLPQEITLEKINKARDSGLRRGLISLTTALGKTFISIFHAKKYGGNVLFLAHIVDILKQAEDSFILAWPEIKNNIGFVTGDEKSFNKQLTLASIQALSRINTLEKFDPNYFTTIVIDETHHATSPTYTKIIEYFKPKFLLGITGTHERHDGENVLKIYDNNLIHQITREEARDNGWIVGLKAWFCKDNVDYSNIFWNGYKYREEDLNRLLIIEERDNAILKKFNELAKGKKTIGFCCSIEHARHMAEVFKKAGIKSDAIHSNTEFLSKDDRKKITKAFRSNLYDVIFTVDAFNEGVDFPDVECLLMLRETQSNVIRAQQLGRGLRLSPGKEEVLLIDFISNNERRSFRKLDFLGSGGEIKFEKDRYYFDNNGDKVIFEVEAWEEYKRAELKYSSSKSVDVKSIPSKWLEFAEDLKNCSQNKLYWKNGQQNKNIPSLLKALEILEKNPKISEAKFKEIYSKTIGAALNNSGFRALFLCKLLGMLDKSKSSSKSVTPVYYEIKKLCDGNFDEVEKYQDVLDDQIEKLYYWNDIFKSSDIQRTPDQRQQFNVLFNIYYTMALYQILLDIGFQTGQYEISKFEFYFFVVTMRSNNECDLVVDQIMELRKEPNKYEIIKHLQNSLSEKSNQSDGMDIRILETLLYSKYLGITNDQIILKKEWINVIDRKIKKFEHLRHADEQNSTNFCSAYNSDNPNDYFRALTNIGTPW